MKKHTLNNLLKNVIADLMPDERKIQSEVRAVMQSINASFKKQRLQAKVIAGGSIAKGVFLKNDHDCDLFAVFPKSYAGKDLSGMLERVLNKVFKHVERLHGSRDYFHVRVPSSTFMYEIVPVLALKKEQAKNAVNITDCSPLHVQWVLQQVKKKKSVCNEIRLLKAFCKSAGVYGAESYLRGFSGHVVDILTIFYGSFLKVLQVSKTWKPGTANTVKEKTVIDFYNKHKGKAFFHLNSSKLQSALIVIDPTLADRNASAALEQEKLDIFRLRAQEFLKKPSADYFVQHPVTMESLVRRAQLEDAQLVAVEVYLPPGKVDLIGVKMIKVFQFLKQELLKHDFKLVDAVWSWGKGAQGDKETKAELFYLIKKGKLSDTVILSGPPTNLDQKHIEAFKKQHRDVFLKQKRWYAREKRTHQNPRFLVEELLKHLYVRERVKDARLC